MTNRILFLASETPEAQEAQAELIDQYGNTQRDEAQVIVALGGDGFMLQTMHDFLNSGIPVYGMNKGTVGFLMNEYQTDDLNKRIETALGNTIYPLKMTVTDINDDTHTSYAINEVSLLRQSYQAASLEIATDGEIRLEALICDGVMLATPAGSTAYNLSARGPILPLSAPLLALTPVSPFRPRRWRGALVPDTTSVVISVNDANKRPVNAVADHTEFKSVKKVAICLDKSLCGTLLFDANHSWDDRILAEQFQY